MREADADSVSVVLEGSDKGVDVGGRVRGGRPVVVGD